jgi:probable phosphoglycerate mutase
MAKKQIFIVRHGETEFNKLNIVQGSGVDMAINEQGLAQAQKFYEWYKNHPFQHIFISALQRTYQSVQPFIESGIPYTVLPQLNEISWGDFEGKQQTDTQRTLYWETVAQWNAGNLQAKIPNGESPLELQARQREVLHHLFDNPHEHVLVCMHGRAMKSFLCLLLNKPLTQMEEYKHTNLCVYHLEFDGEKCHLIKSNDTSHLQ